MFSYIAQGAVGKNNKVLVLTDRTELLSETGGTLHEFDLKPGIVDRNQNLIMYNKNIFVGMAQTLKRRVSINEWLTWFKQFDIYIIDEAHKQEFNYFFEHELFNDKSVVLGFTATPKRTGNQRQLAEDYTVMAGGIQVPDLVKAGYLVPDIYYSPTTVDMTGVGKNSFGEYDEFQMANRFNRKDVTKSAIKAYNENCHGSIMLAFCSNIRHTIETCDAFNEAGIPSSFVVSPVAKPKQIKRTTENDEEWNAKEVLYSLKLDDYETYQRLKRKHSAERAAAIDDWKSGKYLAMFNSGILTTGFNFPAIETIFMLRKLISQNLWLQSIGRGSRTSPGKDHFNIFDFGGNGTDLGFYNQVREYSLIHKKASRGGGVPPIKECGSGKPDKNKNHGCGAYVSSGKRVCEYCGYIFEQEKKEEQLDLSRYDYSPEQAELIKKHFQNQNKITIFEDIDFIEIERRHKTRKSSHYQVYKEIYNKGGEPALRAYARMRGYNHAWVWRAVTMIKQYNK